jgi:magnesium chelatase family protein
VSLHELTLPANGESSADIQQRVIKTKNIQLARYEKFKHLNGAAIANAYIKGEFFDAVCKTTQEAKNLLSKAVDRFNLSARGYHRILRTARTLQDMQDSAEYTLNDSYDLTSLINIHNIATAVNFRH